MLVHGRLRTDVWEREDGQSSVTYVVEATSSATTSAGAPRSFVKAARPSGRSGEEETDQVMKELLHEPGVDLPQLDSLGPTARPDRRGGRSRVA